MLKAARELGYRPNSYRMALRTKRFNAIGLLLGQRQIEGSLTGGVLRSLLAELHGRNQHLLVGEVPSSRSNGSTEEAAAPKMLREWSVDGMLMHCDETPPPLVERLIHDNKIPAIWLNARRDVDCIYPDERDGLRDATERLLGLGHRDVLFVSLDGRPERDPVLADRLAGFDEAIRGGGATGHRLIPNDRILAHDQLDLLLDYLRAHAGRLPTAALCCGRGAATALFTAALASRLSVPRDLSIIAVDDEPVDDPGRRITTMCLPGAEMAVQAVAALNDKIEDPSRPMPSRTIPLMYCEGSTLSAPGGT